MQTDTGADPIETVLVDTSAAVALLLDDHSAHMATLEAVRGFRLGLAGHAWFETYSVVTRLPGAQRRSPSDALHALARNFPDSVFLGEAEAARLGPELSRLGISGGAVYDALVAAAARQHGRPLLSADARAITLYESLGVEVRRISQA
jgi:predicted nucleic acid-binding protein